VEGEYALRVAHKEPAISRLNEMQFRNAIELAKTRIGVRFPELIVELKTRLASTPMHVEVKNVVGADEARKKQYHLPVLRAHAMIIEELLSAVKLAEAHDLR
jgi:hypothetical protein